jgi:DNA-binding CsgD family transcriptional regulator
MSGKGLLERDAELDVIADAVTAAVRARAGGMLLIEGPAGIGKTSLLEAACGLARQRGAAVLRARSGEMERNFSFGVARQLLEAPVAGLPVGDRGRVLGGAAQSAALVVDPDAPAGPLPGDEAVSPGRGFMVLHGLYWVVCNLAETAPLVLGVDDAHWCDGESARFLGYLARRVGELPVLLVVTLRSGEPGSDAAAAAIAGGPARVLRPQPLTQAATTELVRRRLASDAAEDFCQECCRVSGGNPFLLSALLEELTTEGIAPISANARRLASVQPLTVTRGLLARVARLGPDAGLLARAVAVLGGAELHQAAELAGLDLAAAAQAADALAEAEIMVRDQWLEFAHPLVRHVVYESIPPARRALDHRSAAALFSKPVPDNERIAAHLLHAAPAGDGQVVDVLREAARTALRRGAAGVACAHLRRALREPPQPAALPQVTRELGAAELLARRPSAIQRLTDALSITAEPVSRAEIGLLLGKALISTGQIASAEPVLTSAISELGERDSELAVRLETWRSGLGVLDRQFRADLEQRLPLLRPLAERSGPAGGGLLILLAYRSAMSGAAREEIRELADNGLRDGQFLAADTDGLPLPFAMRMLAWIDALDCADRVHDDLSAAARGGSVVAFAIAAVCAASTAMRRGQLAIAEAEARTAAELAVEHELRFYEPFARAILGEALLERGDLAQAAEAVDGMNVDQIRGTGPGALLLYVRGRVRAARGDRAGGAADLRACGETYEAMGYTNPNILPWRSTLALTIPDRQHAHDLVDTELARARLAGQPRGIGLALRARALLSDSRQRLPLLCEAAQTLSASPSALEQARVLADYGTALARSGQRTTAREPLEQAMDLAARCDAQPLVQLARDELRAIGARPRRLRLTGTESLTPAELAVARLAAESLTNRQIAQALFVSAKTVGTHLGHIYDKLAINSRDDLAPLIRAAGRVPH